MTFKILRPGTHTTIQDDGRNGFYHLGITVSGAIDKKNFKLIYIHHKKPEYKALMENIFSNIDYQIKKIVEKENVIRDGRSNYWKRRYTGKKEQNFYLEMDIKIK